MNAFICTYGHVSVPFGCADFGAPLNSYRSKKPSHRPCASATESENHPQEEASLAVQQQGSDGRTVYLEAIAYVLWFLYTIGILLRNLKFNEVQIINFLI